MTFKKNTQETVEVLQQAKLSWSKQREDGGGRPEIQQQSSAWWHPLKRPCSGNQVAPRLIFWQQQCTFALTSPTLDWTICEDSRSHFVSCKYSVELNKENDDMGFGFLCFLTWEGKAWKRFEKVCFAPTRKYYWFLVFCDICDLESWRAHSCELWHQVVCVLK